jgi:hypothetical protein
MWNAPMFALANQTTYWQGSTISLQSRTRGLQGELVSDARENLGNAGRSIGAQASRPSPQKAEPA